MMTGRFQDIAIDQIHESTTKPRQPFEQTVGTIVCTCAAVRPLRRPADTHRHSRSRSYQLHISHDIRTFSTAA